MWNDIVQLAQRRLLQKRFCAGKCLKCNKKLRTCKHDPFEPMVETLDSDYTATRLTMSNTLFAINYFRQVYSLKLWKISEHHFHRELIRLFDGCNAAIGIGGVTMRTTTQLIYFWTSTCHKTTMCGETAPGFMQRTNEHWNALVKCNRIQPTTRLLLCRNLERTFLWFPQ